MRNCCRRSDFGLPKTSAGAPLRSQIPDHGQNFAHQFRVQGASGFVKEHHGWIYRQGAGDGGTLLLTT